MGSVTVKCLVWDLDQTLWRGILLEGGEPRLSDETREVIVGLDARGILQSVASRNDHDQAWQWLEKLGIAEYFVLPQIGWGRKSDAVRQIADQLGFALGTVAFIDDQPTERAEVAFHLPEVRCYPAEQATELLSLPEFQPVTVTADSARRRVMYQAGFRREAARAEFAGPDEEFLRSLDLVMRISRATEDDLARVEELTLRTSQMNATGVYYSDAALRALLSDPGHEVLVVSLADRFGPHGAVGVLLLARHLAAWHLKLLATSCRVIAFGTGSVLLCWLCDQAAAAGVHLVADFRRTERNRMMEIAYRFAGFTEAQCECLSGIDLPNADAAGAAGTAAGGTRRMHLVAQRQPPPSTMTLLAPTLAGSDG
jgi:methoxymalonate biosynthesis protein